MGFLTVFLWYFFHIYQICLSNSVSQNVLGAAFGFSNIVVGHSRFGANAIIGIVFSWSVEDVISLSLIDASFSIVAVALLFILTIFGVICILSTSIEKRRSEEDGNYSELLNKKDEIIRFNYGLTFNELLDIYRKDIIC